MSRCKVLCTSVVMYSDKPRETTRYVGSGGEQETITTWPRQFVFTAAYDLSVPEDQRFSSATPYAEFKVNVDNPAVEFIPGRSYYVDFTEIEPEPPSAELA